MTPLGPFAPGVHKIILADDQAMFRAGTEKVHGTESDLRIVAQYSDCSRLYAAVSTFRGAIVIFASSMRADLARIVAGARASESRLILIAENGIAPASAVLTDLHGVVFRSISEIALLETVRRVVRGERSIQSAEVSPDPVPQDLVGQTVRGKLTPRQMKVVALLSQGYKNKEIGLRLGRRSRPSRIHCAISTINSEPLIGLG